MFNNDKTKIKNTNKYDNHNFDTISSENLCIICWEFNGNIILCLKCKYKYCDNCVKKINGKCCICFRNTNKNNYLYNNNFYSDDFEINYAPYLYTSFFSIISFIITFTCGCIVFFFIFKILLNSLFEFITPFLVKSGTLV
jgi:hypothetical protein